MTLTCDIVSAPRLATTHFTGAAALVIPAYNEARHLPSLLERCLQTGPRVVMVVDDASSDRTREVLTPWIGPHVTPHGTTEVRVLHLSRNHGKQGAVLIGLRALDSRPLDAVALLDGDGQHDPADLPPLAALLPRYHAVIGLRARDQMPWQRRLSNRLVNLGFHLLSGVAFGDVQSGLRVYRPALARLMAQALPLRGGYGLEHASLTLFARHAARTGEPIRLAAAPISCAYGEATSDLGPRAVLQLARQTVREAWRIRRCARRGAVRRGPARGRRSLAA